MSDDDTPAMVKLAANGKSGAARPKPKLESEVGVSLNLPFTSSWNEKTEIFREDAVTVKQLVEMRKNDGQAQALYRLIVLPIRAALSDAAFVPADGGKKEAQFITDMFTLPPSMGGMSVTFEALMAQVLMGVFDGFAAFEKVYHVPKRGPLKGKVCLEKVAHRPSDTITFLVDDSGGFDGLHQRAYFDGRMVDVEIPVEDSFYVAFNEEERKFYGVSYFRSAFYHYDKKAKLYYIAHLAAQRSAVGTRLGKYTGSPTTEERNDFKRSLANLTAAQYMTYPADNFSVESLKEGGNFDILSMINHHNSQMSKSVLAQWFDDSQGTSASTTPMVNFSNNSNELFILMLRTIMNDIAANINRYLIPDFINWNFGSAKYPVFTWGSFTNEQRAAIKETFDKLAVSGQSMNTTPELLFEMEKHLAEELGLEIDYAEIEAEREKQKKLAEEQLQAVAAPPIPLEQAAAIPSDVPPGDTGGIPQEAIPSGYALSVSDRSYVVELSEIAAKILGGSSEVES